MAAHHADFSQQALPVAHLQQEANDNLLLRFEKFPLAARMLATAFLAASAAHHMDFDTMQ
uniref:Uncharacterized protein n=1 Tax=Peronospora matthiolae TaxID=2874970 RepID=A0AAV1UXY7_9STRA